MCGFLGMIAGHDVAPELHLALQALQHRGQDSAGMATMLGDGSRFFLRRGLGHVAAALTEDDLQTLRGPLGLAHVRYPTIGRGVVEDAQPFFYRQPGVMMAHNGNVTNYEEMKRGLMERSIHLMSRCDVEPALCELADALMRCRPAHHTLEDLEWACKQVQARTRGAYSIVAGLMVDGQPTLVVLRDPHGIRPAVVGARKDGAWLASSESVALDALDFQPALEPDPGELVVLRPGREPIRRSLRQADAAPCVFEFVYFARPDAVMSGQSVYAVRFRLGQELARCIQAKGVECDVVVAVPDTARPAATAVGEALGLPLREGFIKNRYSGRTFIMPDQGVRETALRLKLNPIPFELKGRSVLLVDDSIVRGSTLRRVIAMLRDAGAREVHLGIHSPPVLNPCFYGIDMSTEEELFARQVGTAGGNAPSQQELEVAAAEALGANTLTWLTVEGLDRAFGAKRCAACFDGRYPEPVPQAHRDAIVADRRR